MRSRKLGLVAAIAAVTALVAGCSESGNSGPKSGEGIVVPPPVGGSTTPPPKCGPEATAATWDGALPSPADLPTGGRIGQILKAGHLTVGVDVNTELFGYDPNHTGVPQGFDVDIAGLVARALFADYPANPSRVEYRVVTLSGKDNGELAQLDAGKVDLVVRTTTITCARLQNVRFSNPYYIAQQALLMPLGVDGRPQSTSLDDLKGKGKKVCATSNSTAYKTIVAKIGQADTVGVDNALDCLALLEEHQIDGISTDDAILRGMAAQDPRVAITTAPTLGQQPYGILTAVGPDRGSTDLTLLVNAVLARAIADGDWKTLFTNDLHTAPVGPPVAPAQYPSG